ncbi:MAG: hypothetical protein ACRD8W_23800 [Nitrososphaeraceae archaeon]
MSALSGSVNTKRPSATAFDRPLSTNDKIIEQWLRPLRGVGIKF